MNMEKKQIRFINALDETLFFIEDGGEIEIDTGGGEAHRFVCRYIDDYHAWVGEQVYHIREFAEMLERNICGCRPAKRREKSDD
jgi:hypothetical protein